MADYPELDAARTTWRYQPEPGCLGGKVVLVTGAGDGIGRAAAKTYAAFGANVVLLGRTREKLETVSDWITAQTDSEAVVVPCDLAALRDDNAAALANAIGDEWGRLDGILHNASMLGPKVPIAHYPTTDWVQVFQVNVHATFVLTRALIPLLDAAPAASVVLTSSSVGRQGRAYWGAYATSKFAVEGLSEILADEHEHGGRIRFNTLNPGGTRTAMRRAAYPGENPADVPAPEERMDLYLYLMSDAASGVTGCRFDARDWHPPEF
jgi:NAD(P)-dependent dehydrogenase (short-subunit alcohol dehydrogenase family)